MSNSERGRDINSLKSLTVKDELTIKMPSTYNSEQLQSLVAAQMLAGGREIIIKGNKKKIIIPQKTLIDAIGLPLIKLETFLKNVTNAMLDSNEITIRKVTLAEIFLKELEAREIPPFSLN